MPIHLAAFADRSAKIRSTALKTAPKPSRALRLATMGKREVTSIFPDALNKPAATFVPPISTPRMGLFEETGMTEPDHPGAYMARPSVRGRLLDASEFAGN